MANNETLPASSALVQSIRSLVIAAQGAEFVDGTTHLVIPADYKHIDLTAAIEKAQLEPSRKVGTTVLTDLASFMQYVELQKFEGCGYVFADPEHRTLTAVFNDHGDADSPGWRDYRAVYKAELSRELVTWVASNKRTMEQEDFAVFLEDNIADVVEPSGDVLLSIALTLQAKTEVNFSSSRRLDNGQVQLTYNETIDARAGTGAIDIPREFSIGLRLFKNGEGYKLKARLKYRLGGGKVKFWYELDRSENAIEDAFTAYIEKAREGTLPVLIGKA